MVQIEGGGSVGSGSPGNVELELGDARMLWNLRGGSKSRSLLGLIAEEDERKEEGRRQRGKEGIVCQLDPFLLPFWLLPRGRRN